MTLGNSTTHAPIAQEAPTYTNNTANPLKCTLPLRSRRPSTSSVTSDVSEPLVFVPKRPRVNTIALPPGALVGGLKSRARSPETPRKRVRFGPSENAQPLGLGLASVKALPADDKRKALSPVENKPRLATRPRAVSTPAGPLKPLSTPRAEVHPLLRAFASAPGYTLHCNFACATGQLPPFPAFFAHTPAFHPGVCTLELHFSALSAPIALASTDGESYTFARLITDLHAALRTPISHRSWNAADLAAREVATAAFNARVAADPTQRSKGVRLVDYLGPASVFRGIYWADGHWCVRCVEPRELVL